MISVIVPIYNIEKYLDECIQSLMRQTWKDIEILLINDGSTDSSELICQTYAKADSRIKVFSKKNGGLSDARNYGLEHANGDYILFVDGDDQIHPQMAEILYSNLKEYEADISVCSFYEVEENEAISEETGINRCDCYEKAHVMERLIKDNYRTVVAWNKLYKRELFQHQKYAVGRLHEDEAIIHHILGECNRIVYTDCKLYYYKKRDGSITFKIGEKNVHDVIWAWQDRMEFAKENQYYDLLNATIRTYMLYCETKENLCKEYIRKKTRRVFWQFIFNNRFMGKREKLVYGIFAYLPGMYPTVKRNIL